MSNSKRWFSIAMGSTLAVLLLVGVLTVIPALAQGPGGMRGGGMMGGSGSGFGPGGMIGNTQGFTGTNRFGFGPGWMMGNTQGFSGTNRFGPGGMMGGFFNGADGFLGPGGMMGGFGMMGGGMMINPNSPFYTAPAPLTLEETTTVLDGYLASLNDSNLIVKDIMIFDNQAYAQIVEKDTGIGVLEVLVDPTTQAVFPEMGPNMMWNQKYGMMSGYGRYGMGMMMGGFGFGNPNVQTPSAEMPITPAQAVETAQTYLNTYFSTVNLTADEHADPFYGYYTLHVNRDGQAVGMLSVNGYTGQVFPHTWHGKLLEMSGE